MMVSANDYLLLLDVTQRDGVLTSSFNKLRMVPDETSTLERSIAVT
jgi:hypothetical protein